MSLVPETSVVAAATTTPMDDGSTRRPEMCETSDASDVRPESRASDLEPVLETRNLYVRNMPPSFTADDMTELFARFGKVVSVKVIVDIKRGTSLGFGFVLFSNAREAAAALVALRDTIIDGYRLLVRPAEAGTREPGEPSERVLLRKLPPTTTDSTVLAHCSHLLAQPQSTVIAGVHTFVDADGYKTAWLHCTSSGIAQRLAAALNNSLNFPGRQDMPRSRRRTVFAKVLAVGETFPPPASVPARDTRPQPIGNTTTTEITSPVSARTQPSSVLLQQHHPRPASSPVVPSFTPPQPVPMTAPRVSPHTLSLASRTAAAATTPLSLGFTNHSPGNIADQTILLPTPPFEPRPRYLAGPGQYPQHSALLPQYHAAYGPPPPPSAPTQQHQLSFAFTTDALPPSGYTAPCPTQQLHCTFVPNMASIPPSVVLLQASGAPAIGHMYPPAYIYPPTPQPFHLFAEPAMINAPALASSGVAGSPFAGAPPMPAGPTSQPSVYYAYPPAPTHTLVLR